MTDTTLDKAQTGCGIPLTLRGVIAIRPFRTLWIAQAVSILGDFVALFAIQMALVFRMHGTARDVTRVMIAFLAPTVLLGPVAGVWADRWNPRRTMIASDAVRAVLILLLAFAVSRWQIYAVCFLVSSVSCFFAPAQSITLPVLVRREGLIAASGLMQQTMQAIRILSPAAASALAGWLGERACYYGDSLTFVFSAAMLSTLENFRGDRTAAAKTTGALSREWREGMRYILNHPKLSFVIFSMTAGTFATGCFGALLSVFIRDVLHAGRSVFGITGSLIGAGSVAGAAVMTRLARGSGVRKGGVRFASPYTVSAGMAGTGWFVLALAASRTVDATFACAAGIGFSVSVLMVAATVLLQGETPTGIRGRVSSTSLAFTSAAQAASLILAGGAAARFGVIPLFFVSGAWMLACAIGGALMWKMVEEQTNIE